MFLKLWQKCLTLHTVIEASSSVAFMDEIEPVIVSMMEGDMAREIFSKLFAGPFQLNLETSIGALKRLNDSVEYGVSLELISSRGSTIVVSFF